MTDLGSLQDNVTTRLARSLDVELVAEETRRAQRDRPDQPGVVDLVMRGRAALNKPLSPESMDEARHHFERALQLDAESFDALVGLVSSLWQTILSRFHPASRAADLERARSAASKALALKPNSTQAHFARGSVMQLLKKHDDAEAAFATCVALDRNFAHAYAELGHEKQYLAKSEEVFPLVQQAMRLSPRDPNLGFWMAIVGYAYHFIERDADAIEWMKRTIVAAPRTAGFYLPLASAYALTGQMDEARAALETHNQLMPNLTIAALRADNQSDNPIFLRRRGRYLHGLKLAGMPE